ncbi:MAG: cyclic nucleotide-binding domain-containing protein [Chloroflexaceae bacterium]
MQPTTLFSAQSPAMMAFLRDVSVFNTLPDSALAEIMPLLRPVTVPAGTAIVTKGEPGDCMYIIVEGKVRVHDGDLIFNYLCEHEVFGEISLLDQEERSASVTAEVETWLYRLDQPALYELMRHQPAVARGIIQVLSGYLRELARDMADDFAYMQQFAQVIQAAQAVEAGTYQEDMLDAVAHRPDALGQLARVFQQMARQVQARESHLRQQVEALQIQIDKGQYTHQAELITETDYFRDLQRLARNLRQERHLHAGLTR